MIGRGPGIEVLQEIFQDIGIGMVKVEVETEEKGPELHQEKERIDQGLDLVPVLAQIGTG